MNVAIKLFKNSPERDEYKQGIPKEWVAEVIENCDIAPDENYQIMTKEDYEDYIAIIEPLVNAWRENLYKE